MNPFPFANVDLELFTGPPEPKRNRHLIRDVLPPRIFPEIWTRILSHACWNLSGLSRSTALNREVRAICFSTPKSKCDFILARCHGNLDGAMKMLVRACKMPDLIECFALLVRHGAVYDCGNKSMKHAWKNCLLRKLLGRKDSLVAVAECLGEKLCSGVKFSDSHRGEALLQAVETGDDAMIAVLSASSSEGPRRVPGISWDVVVRTSADVAAARDLATLFGLLPTNNVGDIRHAVIACCKKGGDFLRMAAEMLPAEVDNHLLRDSRAQVARMVWAEVDLADMEMFRRLVEIGLKPGVGVVWRYLSDPEVLPQRASDDAFLLELLSAGDFASSSRHDHGKITVRDVLARPDLMRDLIEAHVLKANYLDYEIMNVLEGYVPANEAENPAFWEDKLRLIDDVAAAGGALTTYGVSEWARRPEVPDAYVMALIDRLPHGAINSGDHDAIVSAISWDPPFRVSLLLERSFPVTINALKAAVEWTRGTWDPAWHIADGEDATIVDLVRKLLEHADVPALVALDKEAVEDGDMRMIVGAMGFPSDVNEAPRILPVMKLLVDAGFEIKAEDVALASSRGWVDTRALLQFALEKSVYLHL